MSATAATQPDPRPAARRAALRPTVARGPDVVAPPTVRVQARRQAPWRAHPLRPAG